MTLSFHARSASKSIFGLANVTPCAAIASASVSTFATCSSAFDGMQPDIQTDAPKGGVPLDQDYFLAQIRRPKRRRITARTRPQHNNFGVQITGTFCRSRGGSRRRRGTGRRGWRITAIAPSNTMITCPSRPIPFGHTDFLDHACGRRGHFQCCLVSPIPTRSAGPQGRRYRRPRPEC